MKSVRAALRCFAKSAARPAAKQMELVLPTPARKDEQIRQAAEFSRRMEGEVQPDPSLLSLQGLKPADALRRIDSDFEAFFRARPFTTHNFNWLLHIHAAKNDTGAAEAVFERMPFYRARPNGATFALMVTCASKSGDIALAEDYFDRGTQRFGRSIFLSSALLQAYSRARGGAQPEKAEALFGEDLRHGLRPDAATLTGLINCLRKAGLTRKCWEYFDRRAEWGVAADDVLCGLMVRLCKVTRDAEKAKKLFGEMSAGADVRLTCLHYNGLFGALSSRDDYAQEAIDLFHQMLDRGVQPDSDTFVAVLGACGRARNLAQAFNALTLLRRLGIAPNKYIVAQSLAVYARVLAAPGLPRECRGAYLADAWKIFEQFARGQARFVGARVLNALLEVHAVVESAAEAEELVMPLFERHGVEPDAHTYLVFFRAYARSNQPAASRRLYQVAKARRDGLSWQSLEAVARTALKLADFALLDELLDRYLLMDRPPSRALVRVIAELAPLPDTIYYRLRRFPFGEFLLGGRERPTAPPADDGAKAAAAVERFIETYGAGR